MNSDENTLYNTQYKELIQLVNYQREKISIQQADLTKVNYDNHIYLITIFTAFVIQFFNP